MECINPRVNKWRVRWDFQPHADEEGKKDGVTFIEEEFAHKPSLDEVKTLILGYYNERTRQRITGDLTWNQKPVWLSAENQQDWKAAFDRALQTDGANLPLRFKIGEDQDGQPVYHTFTSLNAFADFWDTCQRYIYQCLSDGWQMKDNIDWSLYATADAGGSAVVGQ